MIKENLHKQEAGFETQPDGENTLLSKPSEVLDTILSNTNLTTPAQTKSTNGIDGTINGIVVGRIVDTNDQTVPMVDFECNASGVPMSALSTVPVTHNDTGRNVALAFVDGDSRKPVVLGFMHVPTAQPPVSSHATNEVSKAICVEKDGETVTISAKKQVVLKCGASSITLTRAGKVLLSGAYVSSRSKGVNRIMGGSVLIN